jgi:hypothetical protein
MNDSEEMFDILNEWNKVDHPTYNETEWISQWNCNSFTATSSQTIASVIKWCKTNNSIGYLNWKEKYGNTDLYKLTKSFDQTNIVLYYSKKNKSNIIYNDGWYVYEEESCLWKSVENADLLQKVSMFMKDKLTKIQNYRSSSGNCKEKQQSLEALAPTIPTQPSSSKTNTNIDLKDLLRKHLEYKPPDVNSVSSKSLKDKQPSKQSPIKPIPTPTINSSSTKVNTDVDFINTINKHLHKIGGTSFLEGIIKQMKVNFKMDITMDKAENLLSFSNGVYELDSGVFRKRERSDYITKCLPIDYREADKRIVDEIRNLINNEEVLQYFGYCLTGLTKHRTNILINTGPAYTGKSTLALIYEKCLPIYFFKLDQNTFSKKYQYYHKQVINLQSPIRLAFLDELNRTELDIDKLKSFCEGSENVNEMYKSAKVFKHQCKLYIATNHSPYFKPDSGIERRGLLLESSKQYLPKDKITSQSQSLDVCILDKFDNIEYQIAYIQLLLPYAKKAFSEMNLTNMHKKFTDTCFELDRFKQLIQERIDITGNDADRLTKMELIDMYRDAFNTTISPETVVSDGKRCGLKYDFAKRKNGLKGVFLGVKVKIIVIEPLDTVYNTNFSNSYPGNFMDDLDLPPPPPEYEDIDSDTDSFSFPEPPTFS